MRNIHLSKAALEPWAILQGNLVVIEEIVTRYFSGEKLSPEEVQMRIHGAKRPTERMITRVDGVTVALSRPTALQGDEASAAMPGQTPMRGPLPSETPEPMCVAVLPLFGTIFPRANLFTDISGATSTEMFGKRFNELCCDPSVGAIVIDVDSPGGQVPGVAELSAKIFEARGCKPIVAVANYLMASAAYWIGTAADRVVVSPSAQVGSIGVFAMHEDISMAMEMEGVKVSLISDGKYKTEGNPYEPLSQGARDAIQASVSLVYERFIGAVANNRGVDAATVRSGFGEGRCVSADEAVAMGMADEVGTLEDVIEDLLEDLMGVPEDETGEEETLSAFSGPSTGRRSGERSARGKERAQGVRDLHVSGEASSEAGPVSEEASKREAESLRNYLDVFGKGV
jgi:signal peptide peptidase SppA